jgi:hypothetical protein
MTTVLHIAFGATLTAIMWRALAQEWPDQLGDPVLATALRIVFPLAAAAGSTLSVAAGLVGADTRRALRHDAASALALFVGLFVIALGPIPRDVIGLVVVLALAARLLPAARLVIRSGAPPVFIFALCFAAYAGLGAWRVASSLPLGDQIFYLLAADRVAHGDFDARIDEGRFFRILGIPPTPSDTATHVVNVPAGPRLIQGYAFPALLAPGWVVAGELGAALIVALFAAWTAMQTWLLLGELLPGSRAARVAWALVALLVPVASLATHIYPNAIGAAAIVTGYRHAFTARHRRPLLAGLALGATAFLNPRDGLIAFALAPFVAGYGRPVLARFAAGAAIAVVASAAVDAVAYGIPIPYAGYLVGAATPSGDLPSTFTFQLWVGLPAMLFDRTFGIAGVAPWLFLAALGAADALRRDAPRLLPAAIALVVSLVALSLYRYWEGGYAPPARYFVDGLPLVAPFLAYGLARCATNALRAAAAVLIAIGVLATVVFAAVPTAALNTAFDARLQTIFDSLFGASPIGWLPSFQPTTPDWYVGAYLRLVAALALVAVLLWLGRRARTA